MTRNQKAIDAKKQHILQLKRDRPQLSLRELANLTGLSHSTVERALKKLSQDERKDTSLQADVHTSSDVSTPSQGQEESPSIGLSFQDSPAPLERKGIVDSAFDSLKGLLGISDKEQQKAAAPAPLSGKLNEKQQSFVNNFAPTASLIAILIAENIWSRIGPDYKFLAPDEETASRIVTPLLRIYARHMQVGIEISPDAADLGAAVAALFGYIYASLKLYEHVKQEKLANEDNTGHRAGHAATREDRTHGEGDRRANFSRSNQRDVSTADGINGHAGPISPGNLTAKEAAQFEALSQLRQRDLESRLRRSGRAA